MRAKRRQPLYEFFDPIVAEEETRWALWFLRSQIIFAL
jgi:hypothetical protein